MQLADHPSSVAHYDRSVATMQNTAWFYSWVIDTWQALNVPHDARVCDVGCGTGALLAHLDARGYQQLSGTDFAPGCVATTQQTVPTASVFVHNIEQAPLPRQFDVITLTGVIDFLPDPVMALQHIRQSLAPGGHVIVSFRNRDAFWPWYHLRGGAHRLPSAWLRHWFLWFTTPLGLRRNDQPHERVYSAAEARSLLRAGGLAPVRTHGYYRLPMFWIPEFPRLIATMRRIDAWARRLPWIAPYCLVFVCAAEEA